MDRRLLLVAAALVAVLGAGGGTARADRLGGNYRGPGDSYASRDGKGGDSGTPAPDEGGDSGGETPPAGGSDAPPEDAPEPEDDNPSPPPPASNGSDGQNRGPAGEASPDNRDSGDAPPDSGSGDAPTPPDTGGSEGSGSTPPAAGGSGSDGESPGTGTGAGTPSAPGTPGGGTSSPGGSSPGKGGPADDRDRVWPFYFEGAREEYLVAALARRAEPRISPRRSSTWSLSMRPAAGRRLEALDEESRRAAVTLALTRLRDGDSRVRDAAVIALGKSGDALAVPFLLQMAARDPDPAVREDALLALGLSGRRDEALPALLKALGAKPRASGPRSAAFAALGLGLLGDPAAGGPLLDLYRTTASDPARGDDAAAAATALGTLGDPLAIPVFSKILAARGVPVAVRCATLHALGKYGSHADPISRREALAAVVAALPRKKEVRQSALLALGGFAEPAAIRVLAKEGLLDPDPHCRNFAAHALGRIAGRLGPASREAALVARELEKASESEVRDRWLFQAGNLALASSAAGASEEHLLGLLAGGEHRSPHSTSSVVMSLGLLGTGSPGAAERLRAAFESRGESAPVRAYAGLAMALSGTPGAAESLTRSLASSERSPAEVTRTAALALGLVGGAEEVEVLVGLLHERGADGADDGDRFFVLGSAVQGLGLLGDATLVDRLRPLLADPAWARRAFSTAALGYLLEPDPARRAAPRLSELFRHHNWRATLPIARAVQSTL